MDSLKIRGEDDFKKTVSFVLDYLKDKVDYADLLIENVAKVEAKLLSDGQELLLPYSSKSAMQLRLVEKDGGHIEVSLGLEDEATMKENIDTAIAILKDEKPDAEYRLVPIPNPEKQRYGKPLQHDLRDIDTTSVMSSVIDKVKEIAQKIGHEHKIQLKPELWLFSQIEEKIIADTTGAYKTQVLPTTFLQVLVKAKQDSKMSQYRIRHADIDEIHMIIDKDKLRKDVSKKIEAAMETSIKLLSARKLSDEELSSLTHYVLMPSTMVFVHEAQGHNFEADLIKEGSSGLFKADGNPRVEKIASDIVDIYDGQPMDENGKFNLDVGFGTQYIDDEGVEVKPIQLVSKGKIVGKMNNRETAAFFNEEPNGHGFSELGDKRVVRMTNTYIVPVGNICNNFDELIADIKLGVMMEGSLGGAVSKDGMSTSLQIGYLIKDGKLTDIVLLPAAMTVVTKSALLTAEAYVGWIDIPDAGFCGKAGQYKYVTHGGPITKLKVTDSINLSY